MTEPLVLADDPRPRVRRLTLNRPAKRNAMSNSVRRVLFDELRRADQDNDVHVIVIRGAGPSFCSGYDLSPEPDDPLPRPIATRDGFWSRHLVEGWFEMMDMATPIIAQVHGYCLAGGSELAAACDLVYVAEDATIGYPPVRTMSSPDFLWQPWLLGWRRSMEAVLTGDSLTGRRGGRGRLREPGVPRRRARGRGPARSPSASRRSPATCSRSTSAPCTARSRRWACAPGCAPAPSSRPWGSTSDRRRSTCRSCGRWA